MANEEENVDFQLIRACQEYAPNERDNKNKIQWERSQFVFSEDLFTLCAKGGKIIRSIHFINCHFIGMPLAGKDNFFGRLVEAARGQSALLKNGATNCVRICATNGIPECPNPNARMENRGGKAVHVEQLANRHNPRIKYKLIITCDIAQRGHTFNRFELRRQGHLKYTLMRGFAPFRRIFARSSSAPAVRKKGNGTTAAGMARDSEQSSSYLASSEAEEDNKEGKEKGKKKTKKTKKKNEENIGKEVKNPMPGPRSPNGMPSTSMNGCAACVSGQYECAIHVRRVKSPMHKPEGADAIIESIKEEQQKE